MLRINWSCSKCGASGTVENPAEMCGACPKCWSHKGEVEYTCEMSVEDFLLELTKMSESEIAKNAYAIQVCAEELLG